MKKVLLSTLTIVFLISATTTAQFKMDSNGDVGIGYMSGDPSYKLHVRGETSINPGSTATLYILNYSKCPLLRASWSNAAYIGTSTNYIYKTYSNYVYSNNYGSLSDISIKENIRDISNPLGAILKIRGVKFDMKREYYANSQEDKIDGLVEESKNKYGVIAQELNEILPDLVEYDEESSLLAVNYVEMIPILIEAIKEQQIQIEELKAALGSDDALKGVIATTSNSDQVSSTLYQNVPNPFTEETTISFSLGESVESASLFIYDMNGKQVKSFDLSKRRHSQISILGGEMDPGIYVYSLVADGLLIGTKQMILTD